MLSKDLFRCKIINDKLSIKQSLQIICQLHLLQNWGNKALIFKRKFAPICDIVCVRVWDEPPHLPIHQKVCS